MVWNDNQSSLFGFIKKINVSISIKNNLCFIVIRSLIIDLVLVKINGLAERPWGRRGVSVGGEAAAAVDQAAAAAQVVAVRVSFKVVAVPSTSAILKWHLCAQVLSWLEFQLEFQLDFFLFWNCKFQNLLKNLESSIWILYSYYRLFPILIQKCSVSKQVKD